MRCNHVTRDDRRGKSEVSEWVEFNTHSSPTHDRSFWGWIFPGNQLRWDCQSNKNQFNQIIHKLTNPMTIDKQTDPNWRKHTKTYTKETKPKPSITCKNCSYECAYNWVGMQLWYTIQHRTVLIIFLLSLQTITIARIIVYWRGGHERSEELWRVVMSMIRFSNDFLSRPQARTL